MSIEGAIGLGILWFLMSVFKSVSKDKDNSKNGKDGNSLAEKFVDKIKEFADSMEPRDGYISDEVPEVDGDTNLTALGKGVESDELPLLTDSNGFTELSQSFDTAMGNKPVLHKERLKEAVIWSEILNRPVSMR